MNIDKFNILNNSNIHFIIKNTGYIFFNYIKNNKKYKLIIDENNDSILLHEIINFTNDSPISNDYVSRFSNFIDIESKYFIFTGSKNIQIIKQKNNYFLSNYFLNIYNNENELVMKTTLSKDNLKYNVFVLTNGKIKLTYNGIKKKYLLKIYNNKLFLDRYF